MATSSSSLRTGRAVWTLFLLSTGLSCLLLWRSQAGGDQLNLLARGWLLAAEGELVPHGNPASGGGVSPGPVTSLVVGLPLFVWMDARAPALLLLFTHLSAFVLFDRLLARCWGERARLVFALLFGLSPLRLFLSAVLWNPGYLLLVGALHAWTAYRQRSEGRALDSFLHVFALGLAGQLHLSAVLLCAASVLLWWRGTLKVHWGGALAGVAATVLTLVPYLVTLGKSRVELFANGGFFGRGLLYLYPLAHGLWNGIRYAALSLPSRLVQFDFSALAGREVDAVLAPLAKLLAGGLAVLTLLVALLGAARFGRRLWRRRRQRGTRAAGSSARWLEHYAVATLLAALLIFSIAPTTPMWWQGVALFHVFLLPTTWLLTVWWRRVGPRRMFLLGAAWAIASVMLTLAMAFGGPHFRCGGRSGLNLVLETRYNLLDDLGLWQRCEYPIEKGGWYPDVMPPAWRLGKAQGVSAPVEAPSTVAPRSGGAGLYK